MIGTSTAEWIFILLSISLLRAIAPLSIIYSILWLFFPIAIVRKHPLPFLLKIYALTESAFFLFVYLPLRARSQSAAVHPPLADRAAREALFEECMQTLDDPETYLRKWFLDAPLHEIKRENLREWVRWGFFSRNDVAANSLDEDEVEQYVVGLERKLGRTIEEGRGTAKSFRLTFDSVGMSHRPLVWYLVSLPRSPVFQFLISTLQLVFIVDVYTTTRLLYAGLTYHRLSFPRLLLTFPPQPLPLARHKSPSETLPYWFRPHTSTTTRPIVYIHGIGIGLYPYATLLADLAHADPSTGILVFEIHPISARITQATASMPVLVAEIHRVLTAHNIRDCVLVANSYGTAVACNVLRSALFATPARRPAVRATSTAFSKPHIAALVLVDPISLLLHQPAVAYNFVKRAPRRANEHQLHYFASSDMCVAHTLSRHFFWTENIVWKRDLMARFGGPVCVCLAGRDLIVDAGGVWKYLTGRSRAESVGRDRDVYQEGYLRVLWFEDRDHAQVFDYKGCRRAIESVVREYCGISRHGIENDNNTNNNTNADHVSNP
ncbi:hypothetical protein EJ05DRAFT_475414 [Pseudovirgaria hyperparasitica]|uniref:AB hydrolase-1 domain-containing protein n=1 Tax=Pseudovirgaria hyperparasitica TaxID=470096 RepID=A0A6A6WAI6_9PEZI|nr:uncharacterized protein EJ05DRAFT_475414 [Pseudovirgaria hyperparasitica]KAF2759189.1 hypothetical protein EJ05DRAFT_475414 [Pseudovirgaria hyperparasitica]